MLRSRTFKIVLALCLVIVLAGTTTAFAESVNFDAPASGDLNVGQGVAPAVTGFTVSSFQFVENPGDPTILASLTVTLDKPATEVKVKLVSTGSFYECTENVVPTAWTCDSVAGVALAEINTINVVAINNN